MTASVHDPFFFTEASLIEGSKVRLGPHDSHHLTKVRRARPGQLINVSDGAGTVMLVKLADLAQDQVGGEIIEKRFVDRPKPSVGMLQGLAKGSKIDFVVQKLVEVGVDRVAIFEAGRSVPLWSEDKKSRALERWRAIGREAAKQSRRAWLPEVLGPMNLEHAVEFVGTYELKLFAVSQGATLSSVLSGVSPQSVIGVVGPEGGFKDSEIEAFSESTKAVSIGGNILRTETAALVLTTALMYHFDRI